MLITKISEPKRHPNRRRIYLDGALAFTCKLNVVARFRLREGMTLTDEQLSTIQQGQVRQECFDQAMQYLKLRLHSRFELRTKLLKREYGVSMVEEVLNQLAEQGYVGDEQFARARAQSACRNKHYGRDRVRQDLLNKGVKDEVVNRVLDEIYTPTHDAATVQLLVAKHAARLRKLDPSVARRRLMGMLQRRGFDEDTVRRSVVESLGNEATWPVDD